MNFPSLIRFISAFIPYRYSAKVILVNFPRWITVPIFFFTFSLTYSQVSKQDSTTIRYDSIAKVKMNNLDSAHIRTNHKIDSIQARLNKLTIPNLNEIGQRNRLRIQKKKDRKDSLQFVKERDAERKKVRMKIDSLERVGYNADEYEKKLDSLNAITYSNSKGTRKNDLLSVRHKTDSLKSSLLSTQQLSNGLDSLRGKANVTQLNSAQQKVSQVEQKLNAPATKIENSVNEKLALMSKEGGAGANLPGNVELQGISLPNAKLPNTSVPNASIDNPLGKMDNPMQGNDKLSELKNAPAQQLDKLKGIDEIQSAQDKLGKANELTDKMQAVGDDTKNIAKGNLNEVKELPKVAEQQLTNIDELQTLQKETGSFDQYKDMAGKAKDPEALKEEAMKKVSTMAVDHFAGKQEALKVAMDKMSKLKSQYSSLSSLKDIPKHKSNEMKGKPLIERLVPGITFQFQKSSSFIIDYNPYIGYRLYGRFTAGIGWNERVSIGKHISFSLRDRIYGPRFFADFKLAKGFSIRTDIEKMNTYVPAIASNGYSTDTEYRAWVWSAFIGLKKEYAFIKKVKGNAQFLYNLYDDHNNSPYADRFAVRMGFEFPMKRKVKKETSN